MVFKASSYPLAYLRLTALVGRVITPILQMMFQEVKSEGHNCLWTKTAVFWLAQALAQSWYLINLIV